MLIVLCSAGLNMNTNKSIKIRVFVSVEEEGAEPHAGSGRRVEEERPRARSSGQEEGGESTPITQIHTVLHTTVETATSPIYTDSSDT